VVKLSLPYQTGGRREDSRLVEGLDNKVKVSLLIWELAFQKFNLHFDPRKN